MDSKLRQLQLIETEILEEIVRICDEHEITYYLAYGTLLGAVRHKGFIPWDDDLDIVMQKKDFERFMSIAPHELKSEYFLQSNATDKNYPGTCVKIRKNGTVYASGKDLSLGLAHYGCWVDIYCLENASSYSSFIFKFQNLFGRLAAHFAFYRAVKSTEGLSALAKAAFYLSRVFPLKLWVRIRDAIFRLNKNEEAEYRFVSITPTIKFKIKLVPRDIYGVPEKVEFEGKLYSAPHDWDKWLTLAYGDYMQLPPEEQRTYTHKAEKWEM